ncbi:P-loop containing nucleoside triphosphate hydrolase protein [Trichoderma sp. SZMC 28014]
MAPEPLDSEETRRLLGTVSSLDDLCLLFVNQPQIIVVGDQGSGKSSVLEAISRTHFPVGDGVCTRFPIELVLRRAPHEHTSLEVLFDTKSLDVGGRSFSRTTRTREPFVHFGFPRNELPALINRAKEHMGLEDGKATGFSRDILLVKIEGPDVPSVTIVDLPGVIHFGLSSQLQDWKPVVDDLIDSYMRQPNSIILTVVSADVPLSAHAVLNRAARFDPDGDRTIGVITKPDLCPSTNIEDQYIRLVKGQEPNLHLPLGWHVLRNRGPKEPAMDYDERDAAEDGFLAEGTRKWWRLPLNRVGVHGLRRNLAQVLLKHIKSRLPEVPNPFLNKDVKKQVRVRLPPFTEYAKMTTATESPFGQVAPTDISFATLLKKEPDISFSASLKGKAPVFGTNVNAETYLSEDEEKAKRVKSESSISSKKVEPGPAASLFGAKAPAVKSSLFGSGATTTTTPVTAFGSVPASSSSTGSTAATIAPAVKPVFGSQDAPKPAVDSKSGSSSTTNTTTATKPLFGSQNPPKPASGTTSSSTTVTPAFGPVSVIEASLFGTATTSQASAPKPSIFGVATTAPAPKPSLFGSGTATSQSSSAKPAPSLFATATSTSQAAAPRFVFGTGLVATSSQSPAPKPSLSGTTAVSSEDSAPKPSLFGTSTTSSQSSAPKPSLFAGASTSSQAPAPKSPLFGTSTTSTATTTAKTTEAPVATSESSNSTLSKTPSTDGLIGSPDAPPQPSTSSTENSSSSIANA